MSRQQRCEAAGEEAYLRLERHLGTVGERCLALCKTKPLEGLPQNKEAFLPPLILFTAWGG